MFRFLSLLATVLFVVSAIPAKTIEVTPLRDDLVSVLTETQGESRDAALAAAKREAVQATAGRVLIDDNLIRADDLLQKYLDTYAENFVTGVEVLDDAFAGGFTVLRSRVFINYEALTQDLQEKRFLYEPAYKPQFAIFLEERLDGQPVPEGQQPAQQGLQTALRVQGLKAYDGAIEAPATSVNVLDDAEMMSAAIVAAERRNIEILFVGTSRTSLSREEELYYDRFYFYDCNMEISMIRVDTGDVLHKSIAEGSASAKERTQAISIAIERASQAIAEDMQAEYQNVWPNLVQSQANYEILLTGTDDELTNIISQHLSQLAPNTEVFLKKKYDNSALLTIRTPAERKDLIETIRVCPYPALTIVDEEGETKFEIQVSG